MIGHYLNMLYFFIPGQDSSKKIHETSRGEIMVVRTSTIMSLL